MSGLRIFPAWRDGSAAQQGSRKDAADQTGLAKVLGMQGQSRLANNLYQIAKAAHIGVLAVSPALIEALESACRDIRIMRNALLSAGFPPAGGWPNGRKRRTSNARGRKATGPGNSRSASFPEGAPFCADGIDHTERILPCRS